ncbi:butyrophilin-like protein 10 [Hyaena hyaena]|uniref:butyrophilin-like protein 10 n=1 Tax=Hyaena hyaena TaxID=95912 RepID=UPI0019223CC1|nr:butyrophilin-like protein 10 [Hyaena hyaena]
MEVRWYREQESPAVHLYKGGRDVPEEQMRQYQGRTIFLTAGLTHSQAALTVHNITVFDNGTFHCKFKDDVVSENTTLWLRVAGEGCHWEWLQRLERLFLLIGLGSEPRMQVQAGRGEGIRAECTSKGWYPEPQVEWRDFRGQAVSSMTNLTVSPTTGLFAVVSNVTVQDRDVGGLFCSISSPLLQERKEAKSQLPVSVLAQLSRGFLSVVWRTVLPVILTVVGLVATGATCLFWKCQRDRNRVQPEEEKLCREEEACCQQHFTQS